MGGVIQSTYASILMGTVLLGMLILACDPDKSKTFTVGVITINPNLDEVLLGFKAGMTELGYVEGKKIRYLYDGPITDMDRLSATVQTLMAGGADLIFSVSTPATLAAKQTGAGSGLPLIFTMVTDPVGAGIVTSLQHPGNDITGITFGVAEARRLEWLVRIAPQIRQIYVPFNPTDKGPVLALKVVQSAAANLGVELITREVHDTESLSDAVLNIPAEADAVFLLPDSLLGKRYRDLMISATQRNLPTSIPNTSKVKKHGWLTSFGVDQRLCGKQAARLADQIFKGIKPADLPVETAEFYLVINLKTAKAIGLTIPDEILRQANKLIR